MSDFSEIKKALEGVTPGPWYEGDKWVYSHPRSGVSTDGLENVLTNAEAQKNARYIAAANPAAISKLISTLETLQRENEELRKGMQTKSKRLRDANAAFERERKLHLENQYLNRKLETRTEAAEAEVERLQAEIDRKSSMPGDHRYWEGRYRDEAAHNDKLREALKPFGKVGAVIDGPFGPALFAENDMAFQSGCAWSENGERKTLTWGDFRRARTVLASTGGEHHAD